MRGIAQDNLAAPCSPWRAEPRVKIVGIVEYQRIRDRPVLGINVALMAYEARETYHRVFSVTKEAQLARRKRGSHVRTGTKPRICLELIRVDQQKTKDDARRKPLS